MTAKKLIDALSVIEENILAEAARMAKLFARAAEYRVDKMRVRCSAEAALDVCDARLSLRYRREKEGERKTEAYYKAKIVLNRDHRRLLRLKELAERREELAKLILDSYRMRRDGIRIIAEGAYGNKMTAERLLEKHNQERILRNRARGLHTRRLETER